MESGEVIITETRFDELKAAERELHSLKYSNECFRHKMETASGLLEKSMNDLNAMKTAYDELKGDLLSAEKERDELREKLVKMTEFRDECERQLQKSLEELAIAHGDINALREKLDVDANENGLSPAMVRLIETEKRLAEAEKCIKDIAALYGPADDDNPVIQIIRRYRGKNVEHSTNS